MALQKYKIDRDYHLLALMNINIHEEKAIRISNALVNRINFLHVDDDISAEKLTINSFDGFHIDLYIYRPKDCPENIPCMVYFHGGGFFLKGDALTPRILSAYIRKSSIAVVYVDYRLSLDYPYPIPVEDCYAGLKWTFENSSYLGFDNEKILVMGFSAGGALAAGVTLLARDRKFPHIVAQVLISPVTDYRQITASAKNFIDTPNWNSESNRRMWELYLRNIDGKVPYYASPAVAPSLRGLPPAYVEVSEFDPLHDEGVNYAKNLKDSGVNVILNDTKGTIHMSSILLKSKKTKKNIDNMCSFIKGIIF